METPAANPRAAATPRPRRRPANEHRGTTRTGSAQKAAATGRQKRQDPHTRGNIPERADSPLPARRAHVAQKSLSPVPHRRRSGCVWGAAGWVCAGCGGCVRVCRGCVAGVCRVCQGVSRACVGGVGGVLAGCVRGAVCAAGWQQCALGSAPPPLPWAIASACVLDAGCAVLRLSFPPRSPRDESRRALPPFRARVCRPSFPRLVSSCVPRDPRCRPLGTSSSFPRGIKQTQTRVCFSPCAPHVAFIRRPRPPSPPHHTQLFAVAVHTRKSKFHPPAKNTPPPLGDPAHGPEWMSGVHLGGFSAAGCISTGFQTARRQGGASKRRPRRCL